MTTIFVRLAGLLHAIALLSVAAAVLGCIFLSGFATALAVRVASHPGLRPQATVAPTALAMATAPATSAAPLNAAASGVAPTVTMDAANATFTFTPSKVTVHAGQTVTWNNTSSAPHTIVGFGTDSGLVMPGKTFTYTFSQVGTYSYVCTLHPGMSGVIVVIS